MATVFTRGHGPSQREFRGVYDVKKAQRDLESAAIKVSSALGIIHGGADVIETYDDPH